MQIFISILNFMKAYQCTIKTRVFCFVFYLTTVSLFAQNSPVSQSANSMVDLLTGDFKYTLPVMTVPGPNGEQVPIVFRYSGGIRMDEQASWIGLGWDYDPGEVSHHVRGISDDWKGKKVTTVTTGTNPLLQKSEDVYFYGPLYYKDGYYGNIGGLDRKMDVNTSSYKLPEGAGFSFPDYDTYNVSGPGLGGTMSPKVYAWGDFHVGDPGSFEDVGTIAFPTSKPVHFYFNDDINQYGVSQLTGQYWGANGTSSLPVQYTPATNRINTGTFVEYFTNNDINSNPAGFLDFRTVTGARRPAAEFDPDGIGAFRITTPDGMTYHYSLPVYMLENEKITSFILNAAFDIDNARDKREIIKTQRYAISWKLTAVTGIDFVDANNNGIADTGDTGYWIAYNYGKWTDTFRWKAPFFNYNPNQYNKREPTNYRYHGYQLERYDQEGTVSTGQMQTFYLNSIQTATHTAFFIKSVRLDAHAEKEVSTNTITPLLRLDKIVLVRNENIPLFTNNTSLPFDNRYSMAQCYPANVTPHVGNFLSNETAIKAATLEAVELTNDYSLCKMLYNNINNTFTTTSAYYSSIFNTEIYRKLDVGAASTTSDLANSGKLTLKEVKTFGFNYKAVAPSHLFDYDQTNPVKNPNYNPMRSDFWGYYKSDFNFDIRGRYTTEGTSQTPGSKNDVDAWSLKKITTPLGGEILIEYESDVYEYVNNGQLYTIPKRYFLIKSAKLNINAPWIFSVSKDIDDFISLPNLIHRSAFIPYFTNLTPATNNAVCANLAKAFNTYPVSLHLNIPPLNLTPLSNSSATTRDVSCTNLGGYSFSSIDCAGYNPVYAPTSIICGWGYIGLGFSSVSGGGIRVKQITLKEPDNNLSYSNTYTYENGAAGSEPTDINILTEAFTIGKNNFANDPNMPPAVVTYGKVTVKSKSLQNTYAGRTEYRFDNMNDAVSASYQHTDPDPNKPCSNVVLYAKTSVTQLIGAWGRPLSVTHFDNNNNIVGSELYEYYAQSGNLLPSVTESFSHHLKLPNGNCPGYDLIYDMRFIKTQYKNLLRKKTIFKDGVYITEETLSRDPSTGAPTLVRITDPTAGITETRTAYAYLQSGYAGMGTRSKDPTAKNLLLAPYKVSIYRDKIIRDVYNNLVGSGNPELISGSRTTWRQTLPKRIYNPATSTYKTQTQSAADWKPYKSYVFNGDPNEANWREEEEITLMNKRNAVIETKGGVTNRYSATKSAYNHQYILCEAGDARYTDFTFTGFEDQELVAPGILHFGGEITQGQMRYAGDANVSPHTGNFLAKVDPGAFGPGYFTKEITPGRSYRISAWVHKNSPPNAALVLTLDGSHSSTGYKGDLMIYKSIEKSNPSNISSGDWMLMTLTIDVPSDYVASGGTLNDFRAYLYNPGNTAAYFDDLAVRPLDAGFTGYVTDEKTGRLQATLDHYNFGTRYVYDNEGRISEIWIEHAIDGWKLDQRNTYNFKRAY